MSAPVLLGQGLIQMDDDLAAADIVMQVHPRRFRFLRLKIPRFSRGAGEPVDPLVGDRPDRPEDELAGIPIST